MYHIFCYFLGGGSTRAWGSTRHPDLEVSSDSQGSLSKGHAHIQTRKLFGSKMSTQVLVLSALVVTIIFCTVIFFNTASQMGQNSLFYAFGLATGIALSATIQYLVGNFRPRDEPSVKSVEAVGEDPIDSLLQELTVNSSQLQNILKNMSSEFKKGLAKDGEQMKMIPSHVVKLPTGEEHGAVLALDMGGTNFRVLVVNLEGKGRTRSKQKKYTLTEEMKQITGDELFDFFADCVAKFLTEEGLLDQKLSLGFTFSFPTKQHSINSGSLMTWAKGFVNKGVEGKDVVVLLEDAFKRRNLNIHVTALVNDTVGTLVTHAYKDSNTHVGVILGTGTNAAYVEKTANVPKFSSNDEQVIINTEWGGYSETSVLPLTKYDKIVDRKSTNPGSQVFEKLISGFYLGELTRVIICELCQGGYLFSGNISDKFTLMNEFDTSYMSRIERDHSLELHDTKAVLQDIMQVKQTTLNDRKIVKQICQLVGTRAARLSAAAIVNPYIT
jgi:hexokinase